MVRTQSKKRKFNGNRYTTPAASSSPNNDLDTQSTASEPETNVDSSSGSDYTLDRSDISTDSCASPETTTTASVNHPENFIINIKSLQQFLAPFLRCNKCDSAEMCFGESGERCGLAATFNLTCQSCKATDSYDNSPPLLDNPNKREINMRFIYAMRTIGRGNAAARMFNALMDLPQPPSHFTGYYPELLNATYKSAEESMQEAARNVKAAEGTDIEVSFDGSWQKRGFQSNNGFLSAISVKTGKILDIDCKSRYCNMCNHGYETPHDCRKNHTGSSGSMEPASAVSIYKRSLPKHGLRYVGYLGDGDSSAFKSVVESKPYGDTDIYKLDCINHVAKRVGARLRNLVQTMTKNKQKLSDGKSINGRDRLTKERINRLQSLYRHAIIKNLGNVDAMKNGIQAVIHHSASSDDNPQHGYCPVGPDTWCKYNQLTTRAQKANYKHKNAIPEAIFTVIKPIFDDLSNEDLLKRCLHGGTQNLNESFNHVVWDRAPKTIYSGLQCFEICVSDAVVCFNDGVHSRIHILQKLGMQMSEYSYQAMIKFNEERNVQKSKVKSAKLLPSRNCEKDYSAGNFE